MSIIYVVTNTHILYMTVLTRLRNGVSYIILVYMPEILASPRVLIAAKRQRRGFFWPPKVNAISTVYALYNTVKTLWPRCGLPL